MKISFTELVLGTGVMLITSWEGDSWCNVTGLRKSEQTPENIAKIKKRMAEAARRPGAPRNGKR
ncbi:putative tail protein [Klebsiella phage vB_KpnS_Uniso31]|uniref:Tail protein n=1 Tax=Klebsiella phage vB_KpnS_Uniso31 TaxID=2951200 RepID=A0A9E7NG66_9CAUD|nr:putative tail protein [Klebsiella phage vB_KpnS_Uniso31]